jgi:putative Mg2+ transporter-C (MgtC) family protein
MHTTEWELLWRLGLALVLSTVIGLEREYRQKSAGLRTYTLVGLGSALGGGLIFVRQDAVRGLTTAAGVWLVAAVAMAAGAGLPVLAVASTLAYVLVTMTYPLIGGREPLTGLVGELAVVEGVLVVHTAETDPD